MALTPDGRALEKALTTFNNERGINVVEAEADEDEETREKRQSEKTESSELVEVAPKTPAKSEAKEPIERPTTRCAFICARWAQLACSRARARSPSPSVLRPAARR